MMMEKFRDEMRAAIHVHVHIYRDSEIFKYRFGMPRPIFHDERNPY
jgi:hypothetical protein